MRYLLFSVLAIFSIGVFAVPEVFAQSNSTDTTPPVITVPSVQIFNATNSSGIVLDSSVVWGGNGWIDSVTAVDAVTNSTGSHSQSLSFTCNHGNYFNHPNYEFPLGTTTITCTATDYAENTAYSSFIVIVNLVAPTVSTITVDSFEIWENYGNTRFEIEGHAPDGPILFLLGSDGSDDEYLITKLYAGNGPAQDPTWYGLEGGLIPLLTPHISEINQNTNHFIKVCTYDGEINYDNTIGGQPYGGQGGMMTAESKAMLTLCETEYFTWEEFRPWVAVVRIATSASTPGCEETTEGCFTVNYPTHNGSGGYYGDFLTITEFTFKADPSTVTIASNGVVYWENTDNVAHTITSGSPIDGPSGHWDSGLIMAGGSYMTEIIGEAGTYHYYCSLHPWMVGTVSIGGGENVVTESGQLPEAAEAAAAAAATAAGGSGITLSAEGFGSTVIISGYTDRTDQDVVLAVTASNGNVVTVALLDVSDGYSGIINVSALDDGTYTIAVNQGSSSKYNLSVSIDVFGGSSTSSESVSNIVATDEEPEPEPEAEMIPPPNTVYNAPGSSTPGCEPNCFIPSTITVAIGETVTWENTDTAAHTATSGGGDDGPSGVFDSSLIMAGGSYSYTADTAGTFDYFCMVHPWMEGTVIVGTAEEAATATAAQAAAAAAAAQAAAEAEAVAQAAAEAAAAQAAAEAAAAEAAAEAAAAEAAAQAATWAEDNPGMILNQVGSSTPGCEPNCFIPNPLTIEAGDTVTWVNGDTAAHTATAGSAADGPSGVFDSSLVMAGGSYSVTFYSAGTVPYFCMVHPWMEGTVIVEGTSEPEPETTEAVETEAEVVTESDEITVGSEIQIQTDIVNQQDGSQIFAYIVQIKYEDGTAISISTITGSLAQGQTLTQSISWTPDEPGTYVAEIFIWDDLDSANPLSSVEVQYFTVT